MRNRPKGAQPQPEGARAFLLNVQQLAEHLGCGLKSARATTKQKKFPPARLIGKRRFWSLPEVSRFFQQPTN